LLKKVTILSNPCLELSIPELFGGIA